VVFKGQRGGRGSRSPGVNTRGAWSRKDFIGHGDNIYLFRKSL